MKSVCSILFGKILFVLAASLFISACSQRLNNEANTNASTDIPAGSGAHAARPRVLSLSEAEQIMGEPMHLADSTATVAEDVITNQFAYKANVVDTISKKTGAIYFLLQEYKELTGAQRKYSMIKDANEAHGIQELKGVGDEAYFHSDGVNFYFVMVRKGTKVFNMKVNKITSTTSLAAFNEIAKQISIGL